MLKQIDVAIIGAGPYGLSLAAHLGKVKQQVFGRPMGTWQAHMPPGMHLKSDAFACNLYAPGGRFPLREYCRAEGIGYEDKGLPVALETFSSYGLSFQRRFVPDLDSRMVSNISRHGAGFQVTLDDGAQVRARRVVVAVGLTSFAVLPEILSGVPEPFVSHSSQCEDVSRFKDREVVVLGAGASAVDMAIALHAAGARPSLVTRRGAVPFHGKAPVKRSLLTRLKSPWSGLGPGWRSRLACDLPLVFHALPRDLRIKIVRKHLGPAPGWFTRDKFVGQIPMHTGLSLRDAGVSDGRLRLTFQSREGGSHEIETDHVVAGTGYQVNTKRLSFLDPELMQQIKTEEKSPILSAHFESSVPGLYFIGPCAAYSFGPLLRFAFGAGFTSPAPLAAPGRAYASRAQGDGFMVRLGASICGQQRAPGGGARQAFPQCCLETLARRGGA